MSTLIYIGKYTTIICPSVNPESAIHFPTQSTVNIASTPPVFGVSSIGVFKSFGHFTVADWVVKLSNCTILANIHNLTTQKIYYEYFDLFIIIK